MNKAQREQAVRIINNPNCVLSMKIQEEIAQMIEKSDMEQTKFASKATQIDRSQGNVR